VAATVVKQVAPEERSDAPIIGQLKIDDGHVAYVDIRANPNPNEIARKAADEIARDFKCGKDEVRIVGSRGRAIELAKP